jgi:outer membrane murein-binding lipoprotein Lpp
MKRFLVYVATGSLLVAGCTETNLFEEKITQSNESIGERRCVSMELLQSKFQSNPELKERYESIEAHTQSMDGSRLNSLGKIEIPVVVNVLYNYDERFFNPTLERIQSQIDVLNEDFNATNPDVINTPPIFAGLVAILIYNSCSSRLIGVKLIKLTGRLITQ